MSETVARRERERFAAIRRRADAVRERAFECECVKAETTRCRTDAECFHFAGYRAPECLNCHNTGIQEGGR